MISLFQYPVQVIERSLASWEYIWYISIEYGCGLSYLSRMVKIFTKIRSLSKVSGSAFHDVLSAYT